MRDTKTQKGKMPKSSKGIKDDFAMLPYRSRVLRSMHVLEDIRSIIHDTYNEQCTRAIKKDETLSDIKSSISTNMLEDAENYINDAIESLRSSLGDVELSSLTTNKRGIHRKTKVNDAKKLTTSNTQKASTVTKKADNEKMQSDFAEIYRSINFGAHTTIEGIDKTE